MMKTLLIMQLCLMIQSNLATARVPDTSDTSATQPTGTTRVRRDGKILTLITTRVKIFSHPRISYMVNEGQQGEEQFYSKNYLSEVASFPCQNAFEKCTTKTELWNGKTYFKTLCTRLQLQMPLYFPIELHIAAQPPFR